LVEGRCVLELGAGTGVLGALCAQLGASQVTITDLEVVVPLLELNLLLNFASGTTEGGKGGETNSPQSATPVAMALPWGEPLSPQVTARIGGLPNRPSACCSVTWSTSPTSSHCYWPPWPSCAAPTR
jgi:hypothetical protein